MHNPMQHAVLYILHSSYISSDQSLPKKKSGYKTDNEIFALNWHRKSINFVLLGLILLSLQVQYKEHYTHLYLSLLIFVKSLKLFNNPNRVIIKFKQC